MVLWENVGNKTQETRLMNLYGVHKICLDITYNVEKICFMDLIHPSVFKRFVSCFICKKKIKRFDLS